MKKSMRDIVVGKVSLFVVGVVYVRQELNIRFGFDVKRNYELGTVDADYLFMN